MDIQESRPVTQDSWLLAGNVTGFCPCGGSATLGVVEGA